MHAAETLLERHRALHRCGHHVEARVAVLTVLRRTFDIGPRALKPVERDAVRRRIERGREESFDAMRDGGHAGRGGEHRRRPSVSDGSQIAAFGSRCHEWKPSLWPLFRMMIAPRATSLPVPEVVSTAISGAHRSVILLLPPSMVA